MSSKSKAEIIEERVAKLPKPEDPPAEPDFNSLNEDINTHPGEEIPTPNRGTSQSATVGLDGTATKGSGVREADGAKMDKIGRK